VGHSWWGRLPSTGHAIGATCVQPPKRPLWRATGGGGPQRQAKHRACCCSVLSGRCSSISTGPEAPSSLADPVSAERRFQREPCSATFFPQDIPYTRGCLHRTGTQGGSLLVIASSASGSSVSSVYFLRPSILASSQKKPGRFYSVPATHHPLRCRLCPLHRQLSFSPAVLTLRPAPFASTTATTQTTSTSTSTSISTLPLPAPLEQPRPTRRPGSDNTPLAPCCIANMGYAPSFHRRRLHRDPAMLTSCAVFPSSSDGSRSAIRPSRSSSPRIEFPSSTASTYASLPVLRQFPRRSLPALLLSRSPLR